jgi:peptidoglycan/LPS O-acetylase OafA/YrhL
MNAVTLTGSSAARIPELDGVRGIAIGMVLIYHLYGSSVMTTPGSPLAYAMTATRLTWSGVDLFFVLSGFLIGGILLDNREATNYFRTFYVRRFFRIVPIYFLCLTTLYVLMRTVEHGAAPRFSFLLTAKMLPWAPHFFFVQNFWMAARNYNGFLGITWSLAVEEQFYLTLPFLIRVLNTQRLIKVVCAVILGAPILRTALYLLWPGHSWAGMSLLPCRADSLLLGVLGAIIVRSPRWKECLRRNRTAMRVGLVAFGVSLPVLIKFAHYQHGFGIQSWGFTWLALSYLCFILYGLIFREGRISGLLRCRPLRWLGTVAYGAYLYHAFVLWAVFGFFYASWPRIENLPELGVSFLVIALILVLCQISWVFVEKPLIQLSHNARYRFEPATSPGLAISAELEASAGTGS